MCLHYVTPASVRLFAHVLPRAHRMGWEENKNIIAKKIKQENKQRKAKARRKASQQ